MKVWEETWTVSGTSSVDSYDRAVRLEVPDRQYLFGDVDTGTGSDPSFDEESKPEDEARARLAAQAPAMARVLLYLAEAKGTCVYCHRDGHTDPCNTLATGHYVGCIIGDVLEAAGAGDWPADYVPKFGNGG